MIRLQISLRGRPQRSQARRRKFFMAGNLFSRRRKRRQHGFSSPERTMKGTSLTLVGLLVVWVLPSPGCKGVRDVKPVSKGGLHPFFRSTLRGATNTYENERECHEELQYRRIHTDMQQMSIQTENSVLPLSSPAECLFFFLVTLPFLILLHASHHRKLRRASSMMKLWKHRIRRSQANKM
jgi:hypothetical protein